MDNSGFWLLTARRLARRLDLARWLERVLPVWAATSIVVACGLLLLRNRGVVELTGFWLGAGSAFVLSGLTVFILDTRKNLTRPHEALVWLEHRLELHNRLSSASAGVGPWPSPREEVSELLSWRPTRLLPPPLFSAALIAAAIWIPVSVQPGAKPPPIAPPVAWTEMERWLEELEATELVDESAVAAWEDRVDSLESQPKEEWYRHSSLEAGESLRDELASELRALERSLSAAEASLTELIELDDDGSSETLRLARERLGESLEDLELSSLPLSRKIKRQLMTLTRERDVKRMTKEQLERLRERLRERRYAGLPRPGDEAYAFLTPGESGESSVSGEPGRGGVTRGPGSAPIELAEERTELGTDRIEDVLGHEPLGAELGENVAVGIGEHDIDTSGYRPGQEAGAVDAPGEGGELVWSQTLSPEERQILEKYFK